MMLLYFRNSSLNKFQSIMGILMFSKKTECSLQSIARCIRLTTAYSTTLEQLYSMSSEASQWLKQIGLDWMKQLASFHVVYDNMNQYWRVWHQSIDSKAELESGTATTLGNQETMHNIIERQLGIPSDAVEGCLIPTSGDCATIAHLQTLKHNTSSGSTWFSSNKFIFPLIELWHMKFAMLKGIVKAHWPEPY